MKTMRSITFNSPASVVVLGLCALAVGIVMAQRTSTFLSRSISATCTVDSTERRSFSVWCEGEKGVRHYVEVRKPWLVAPWAYGRGEKVEILYEPDAFDEVDPFVLLFTGPPARVHSPLHVWTPAVAVLGAALCLIALGAWSALSGGRLRTPVKLELGTSSARR